ncbi:unnamed protein product [Sphagnum jensenii]|uniref:Uncharacterized protein n=1 Tax=Sphagnum jensenii TaxID=128206 RepID=A0ABP0V7Z2_9BRYO
MKLTFCQSLVNKYVVPAAKSVDLGVAVSVPYTQAKLSGFAALIAVRTEEIARKMGEKSAAVYETAEKQYAESKQRVAEAQSDMATGEVPVVVLPQYVDRVAARAAAHV